MFPDSPMVFVEGFVMFTEYSSSLEPLAASQYQALANMFGLVLLNVMACRVFRLLRLESRGNVYSRPTSVSTIRFDGCSQEGTQARGLGPHV